MYFCHFMTYFVIFYIVMLWQVAWEEKHFVAYESTLYNMFSNK